MNLDGAGEPSASQRNPVSPYEDRQLEFTPITSPPTSLTPPTPSGISPTTSSGRGDPILERTLPVRRPTHTLPVFTGETLDNVFKVVDFIQKALTIISAWKVIKEDKYTKKALDAREELEMQMTVLLSKLETWCQNPDLLEATAPGILHLKIREPFLQ